MVLNGTISAPCIRFALIGDCHYSQKGNYATRDCLGARDQLARVIARLNTEKLDFVLSLGDLGDGHSPDEIPAMLEEYRKCVHPVYFAVGNHDLCQYSEEAYARLTGMTAPFYDFTVRASQDPGLSFRFLVLNPFEISRYSASPRKEEYFRRREADPFVLQQNWPGFLTEASWQKLEYLLADALAQGQQTILVSHVPTYFAADGQSFKDAFARIPEDQRMLELLDRYPNVRAYLAGHFHPGNTAVRKGVLHKTLRSVCDHPEPTACIFEADRQEIRVKGIGAEKDFVHPYTLSPASLSGSAPPGAYVMTNCGDFVQADAQGHFEVTVPYPGIYALKVMKEDCADTYLPFLQAPADELSVKMQPDSGRKVHVLDLPGNGRFGYSALDITADGEELHWFDAAGTAFGTIEPDVPMWHEHGGHYYAKGKAIFTAKGDWSADFFPNHEEIRQRGWYKGDLHAHLIHGENLYIGNVQESAMIGRAEGYDWLYMAYKHGNDGYSTDTVRAARYLSDEHFLYRLNAEFPKARSNHFGNIGVEPVCIKADYTGITSLELADRFVWQRGGITIPVHPFEGHMSMRQMYLWLLCAPEKVPCIDYYYHDSYAKKYTEDHWFGLLNRGYEIGCFASSDAAFDVGRTPGTRGRGAVYVKAEGLREADLIEAIMHRRTMISYDHAVMDFAVDGHPSGSHLKADGTAYALTVRIWWKKGARGLLRIVQNGADLARVPIACSGDETALDYSQMVSSVQNGWVLAILENEEGKVRSAVSPVFFRNAAYQPPKRYTLPVPFPAEWIEETEKLEPDDLADLTLLDRTAEKLEKRTTEKEREEHAAAFK